MAPASYLQDYEALFIRIYLQRKVMGSRVAQPSVGMMRSTSSSPAFNCSSCCLSCLHLQFLQTAHGTLKIAELLMGGMCQSMLINFGVGYSATIGSSYITLLTTTSACLMTTTLLVVCYILSENSYRLIRSSMFETLFNGVACFSYLSASSFLAWAVRLYLYPQFLVTLTYLVYPAMTACYMMGIVLGLIHGLDAYHCYRHFKGYR